MGFPRHFLHLGGLLLAFLLASCGSPVTPVTMQTSPESIFPAENGIPGWTIYEKAHTYKRENLYDLMDGQSEAFFAYGFVQVIVQRYQNASGDALGVEVWQVKTPADAFGLFTSGRSGLPVEIGKGGDSDPGRRLSFWQDHYYVHIVANQDLPDETIWAFAHAVSSALPQGGQQPDLISQLPQDGLETGSVLFFHEEISIQNELWLGGENLLGLGPETNGVLAHYDLEGNPAILLLVQYPAGSACAAGLSALEAARPEEFVAARANDYLLGAVFGPVDESAAQSILEQALRQKGTGP